MGSKILLLRASAWTHMSQEPVQRQQIERILCDAVSVGHIKECWRGRGLLRFVLGWKCWSVLSFVLFSTLLVEVGT